MGLLSRSKKLKIDLPLKKKKKIPLCVHFSSTTDSFCSNNIKIIWYNKIIMFSLGNITKSLSFVEEHNMAWLRKNMHTIMHLLYKHGTDSTFTAPQNMPVQDEGWSLWKSERLYYNGLVCTGSIYSNIGRLPWHDHHHEDVINFYYISYHHRIIATTIMVTEVSYLSAMLCVPFMEIQTRRRKFKSLHF